jgi:metallo-beta-lactamase class B
MKKWCAAGLIAIGFLFVWSTFAQNADTADAHRALAKAAAGSDFMGVYNIACPQPPADPAAGAPAGRGRAAAGAVRQDPPREQWYAEPVKVFDNLYFVGTKVHGAWAVTTSDGIIVIEALFGYAAEPEIAEGLRKLGLDPAKIKYVVVSHGHGDHSGGAKYLQDAFNPHLMFSAADWDLLDRDTRNPKPRRDMVVTDGEKLTLGDTTLTMYLTPGHTLGTISTLIPVKDLGKPHLAMEWGGTAISAATPIEQLKAYVKSAERFQDLAVGAGADVIISNHTVFDGTLTKLEAEGKRKPGDPNPYVVGKDAVKRYLTVAEECGKATLITAQARAGSH